MFLLPLLWDSDKGNKSKVQQTTHQLEGKGQSPLGDFLQ